MELVQVRIRATVITSRYGALGVGDLLRTDAAYAKHLVEECAAAEYVGQLESAASDTSSAGSASEAGAENATPAPPARRKRVVK